MQKSYPKQLLEGVRTSVCTVTEFKFQLLLGRFSQLSGEGRIAFEGVRIDSNIRIVVTYKHRQVVSIPLW
jgi:hypothetical protein